MEKKKLIIIIISAVLVCALAFCVFWKATEDDRYIKGEMDDIQEQVDDFRSGERDSFHIYFLEETAQDSRMDEFLTSLVKEMCKNDESYMLKEFLGELEYTEFHSKNVLDTMNEHFSSVEPNDFKDFEQMRNDIDIISSGLKYYKVQKPSANRDTDFIAEYINEKGTNAITTTTGEGFYADQKNESSRDVVGLPNSPLHDSKTITYAGDFKYVHSYGVRLNGYYEETPYSNYKYYFRDNIINFTPNDGELVWSGDYLFCFSPTGELLHYSSIE